MLSRYCFLIASTLLATVAQAQDAPPRGSLQLGIGSAGVGTGDYMALKAHLEYARLLGRHLSTGTRLAFVGGSRESFNTVYNPDRPSNEGVTVPYAMSYQAINLEQEFYLYPFGNDRRVLFAVGGGGYAGYSSRYGAPSTRLNPTTGTTFLALDQENGLHAGYLFSFNLDVAVDPARKWLVGGKALFQNDTFGNSLATLQLKVGRHF
ncbi:hypothetical protein [Hymenobacter canadensis]|uniref:Outer membrane protein beta-barrel domain-containing protein n=1 Tax=Hymenobacter canadensis TaxID=2999067 RepID=A0ABY7LSS3_9BACT|nr:hypothetical protein [Hymenobacter canadensis]WBA43468.1 hypothetical protein O3303_07835 [Hymenobacter canadensis]